MVDIGSGLESAVHTAGVDAGICPIIDEGISGRHDSAFSGADMGRDKLSRDHIKEEGRNRYETDDSGDKTASSMIEKGSDLCRAIESVIYHGWSDPDDWNLIANAGLELSGERLEMDDMLLVSPAMLAYLHPEPIRMCHEIGKNLARDREFYLKTVPRPAAFLARDMNNPLDDYAYKFFLSKEPNKTRKIDKLRYLPFITLSYRTPPNKGQKRAIRGINIDINNFDSIDELMVLFNGISSASEAAYAGGMYKTCKDHTSDCPLSDEMDGSIIDDGGTIRFYGKGISLCAKKDGEYHLVIGITAPPKDYSVLRKNLSLIAETVRQYYKRQAETASYSDR